jgi:HK97 family phage major capsid protein/HK97 family phage prohead protease
MTMMMMTRTKMTYQIRNLDAINHIREDDDESGVYIFPLSSELPVRTWDGDEILLHGPENVNLEFLNSGNAPLLDSHIRHGGLRSQLGVVVRAWLEDKRLYVAARFSNRPAAQEVRQDVDDGIVTNVSVGYDVNKVERDENEDSYRATLWTPKEASFCSIPADATVGMGRSANTGGHQMAKDEDDKNKGTRTTPAGAVLPGGVTEEQRAEALENAVNEITALAAEHNQGAMARSFIQGQLTRGDVPNLALFKGFLRAELPDDTPLVNTDIGLSQQETRQFSVVRLAASMRDGATPEQVEAAAFEREACAAVTGARYAYGLPSDLMSAWGDFEINGVRSGSRAAMSTGGNANVQTTDHLAARFIDNLRNALVLGNLGVTMLPGLDGDIEIPGGDANIAAAWLAAEDADAAESNATFRKITMGVKDLAVYTDLTRRMLQQSTIAVEQYVRNQIVQGMAEAIDLAGFYGSGATGVPTGLANTIGIGSETFTAAVPTRDELIDMDAKIGATNRLGDPHFVFDTTMGAELRKTKVDAGSGVFLMSKSNELEIGNPVTRTNQITSGDVFAGVWQDMLMGLWGSLELDRSTEAKFLSGGVRLRAIQSVDFGVTRVGSFVLGNDTP